MNIYFSADNNHYTVIFQISNKGNDEMIKGVSKKIIEINSTDNIYFERAVLYIRPEMSDIPEGYLSREADLFLSEKNMSGTGKKISRKNAFVVLAAAVLISALLFKILPI